MVTGSISDGAYGHKHGSVACAPSHAMPSGGSFLFWRALQLLLDVERHLECCWILSKSLEIKFVCSKECFRLLGS